MNVYEVHGRYNLKGGTGVFTENRVIVADNMQDAVDAFPALLIGNAENVEYTKVFLMHKKVTVLKTRVVS
jgi:hypothetical protein